MKTVCFLLLAAVATAAFAAEIPLSDGRVLHESTIRSQTPRTVYIQHNGGLCSVAKDLLPPELHTLYPVDEAAARAADEQQDRAAAAAREVNRAEAERLDSLRIQSAEQAASRTALAKTAAMQSEQRKEAERTLTHKRAATCLVEHYFAEQFRVGTSTTSCTATVREFRPINGRSGPWILTGTASITSELRYDAYDHSSSRHTGIDQKPATAPETREFEAVYSADGPEPTISVTGR